MKFNVRVLACIALALAALVSVSAMAKESAENILKIQPPKLVECRTSATCDRDPKHLEDFVVQFYQWYNFTASRLYPARSPDAEAERGEFKKQVNQYISSALHRKYYSISEDNDFDRILCAQDFFLDFPPKAILLSIESSSANMLIQFPSKTGSGKQYVVKLKAIGGAWILDDTVCQ
jgi:hypothetical protein